MCVSKPSAGPVIFPLEGWELPASPYLIRGGRRRSHGNGLAVGLVCGSWSSAVHPSRDSRNLGRGVPLSWHTEEAWVGLDPRPSLRGPGDMAVPSPLALPLAQGGSLWCLG